MHTAGRLLRPAFCFCMTAAFVRMLISGAGPHFFWKGSADMAKNERKKPSQKAVSKIREVSAEIAGVWNGVEPDSARADVLGSYTGTPKDRTENPVQDADDL